MDNGKRPADMERYILDHFDEALRKRRIKVYCQPVVRTLTRQVCGMEMLARWEDPKLGLLMPGLFIDVLERHRRIHELDLYVLRTVCEAYKLDRTNSVNIDVPFSVNLSRLDYELCDVFAEVEAAVTANKVPRSSLCIEITESALASNEALMRQYIERFRSAGYALWMDDFGSGYSSLNVLKDYEFDELKIDMRFLSDFHTRSKRILASIVHMAKDIGIQTLAEGVETEEQFDFLRNIGCDKVQGYLFGRPMPFDILQKHVAERGLSWESPRLRRYYDEVGRLNVLSPDPFRPRSDQAEALNGRELNSISLALVELRGKRATMLFSNAAFDRVATAVDWPLVWAQPSENASLPLNRVSQRLQQLLEAARTDGESKHLTVYDNDYYETRAFRLAKRAQACTILVNVTNLSQISDRVSQQQLDDGLRSLYSVYEQVSLINLTDSTMISLHLEHDNDHKLPTGNLLARIEEYAAQRLYPEDRTRFRQFMCPETLEERAAQEGGISIYLRVLSFHGSFDWKYHQLVRIRQNVYYLMIRNAEQEVRELREVCQSHQRTDDTLTPELLWENAVNHADLKFFWKDTQRRFVGASRSFMDHYSFRAPEDFVGKTDEDMGWHIHNDPFRDEEWKVLNEGVVSQRVEGNCLVHGENHEIVATKMPLYSRDGKIVGLMGSFYQTDGSRAAEPSAVQQARTDDLTELLNSRGLNEDLFAYMDEYKLRGRDFARVEVSIDDFEDINARYGYDFGDAVLREAGQALLECCGNTATVARVSGCEFTVLCQFETAAELDKLAARIRKLPAGLRQIDGVPFNLYFSVGTALFSETENRESMAAQAVMRRMTDDVESISQRQLMENTGQIFRMFDELPLSYAVFKMIRGPEGDDAIVLYVNRRFLEASNLTAESLIGRRASAFFPLEANDWIRMAEMAGTKGKRITGRFHEVYTDLDLEITAYPVIGPGFCAFTFQKVEG